MPHIAEALLRHHIVSRVTVTSARVRPKRVLEYGAGATRVVAGTHVEVRPQQATFVKRRLSCRDAVVDAIERLQSRTGATEFAGFDDIAVQPSPGDPLEAVYVSYKRPT